jgi:hypothetical protein
METINLKHKQEQEENDPGFNCLEKKKLKRLF